MMEPRETNGSNGQGHRSDAEESDRVLQHDLRTPLAVICGHAQLLQRRLRRGDALDRDELLRTLGHVQLAAKAIEARLSDLDHTGQPKGKSDEK